MALKGKTTLVTGATGGIGEAFARAFAAERCNIVFNGLGDAAANITGATLPIDGAWAPG